MNSLYSRLVVLQEQTIESTFEINSVCPILYTLDVSTLPISLCKEEADDILRTIRRTAPSKKAGKLTCLPLFKVWFFRLLLNKFTNLAPAQWDLLLTFGGVDYSNITGNTGNQLDSFFQEGIVAFLEPNSFERLYPGYGLTLMAQINQAYIVLYNFDEILMIKQFLKTATDGSQDQLIEEAQIVGYYI